MTRSRWQLGRLLGIQGKTAESLAVLETALDTLEKSFPPTHPMVIETKATIAMTVGARAQVDAQQCSQGTIPTGAGVCIDGLVSRPEWNGRHGTVVCFDGAKNRYGVKLEDGVEVLLKPDSLKRIRPTAQSCQESQAF